MAHELAAEVALCAHRNRPMNSTPSINLEQVRTVNNGSSSHHSVTLYQTSLMACLDTLLIGPSSDGMESDEEAEDNPSDDRTEAIPTKLEDSDTKNKNSTYCHCI